MWHFESKCQKIGALVKANRRRLNASLASRVRNFGLSFVALKLVEFPLYDNFFPNLAIFRDLDIFSLFDFPNFDNFPNLLACSIPFQPTSNLSTSSSSIHSYSGVNFSDGIDVFSIEMSGAIILLKPWINYQ